MALFNPISANGNLRAAVQRVFRSFGYHIGRFPPADSQQHHLKELFSRLDINCVIDVGAHEGEFARSIREIGYDGRIIAFEPIGAAFRRAERSFARDPNWRGCNLALGARDGELPMNVYRGSTFSSFRPASRFGVERFRERTTLDRVEVVPIRRLDAVFHECVAGIPRPSVFLKTDTQGWDIDVIEGARGCLDQIKAIQAELSVKPIYDGVRPLSTALMWFSDLGFEPSGMFPVTRDLDGMTVIEFDCVMVRVPEGQRRQRGTAAPLG